MGLIISFLFCADNEIEVVLASASLNGTQPELALSLGDTAFPLKKEHQPLLDRFVPGEPLTPKTYAELVGTIDYSEHGQGEPELEFRVSKIIFELSEEDRLSVFNHEMKHFDDLRDPTIQNRLLPLPPTIRKDILELRAYVHETKTVDWDSCSNSYRKKVLYQIDQLNRSIMGWAKSQASLGALNLKTLRESHSRRRAKAILVKAKSSLVESLLQDVKLPGR